jgi:dolichol-phosphate mannosyltransferase
LNEEENLPLFRQRVAEVVEKLQLDAEFVLVDDHSTDQSAALVKQWQSEDPRVAYIRLSRTSGSHAAYSAGLAHCTGDCAVLLAADLQDPPETIPRLLAKRQEGYDVVWAARQRREGESFFTMLFSRLYYQLMRATALPEMPPTGADFLLMDRRVIDAYNAIPEKHTSFLAMVLWMGFRQTVIEYVKQARHAGKSKWNLSKKLKLVADSVVSFSYAPIRLMSLAGFLMAAGGFLYAGVVVVGWFAGWVTAGVGFAAIMTVLLVGQGAILMMLGILGEYLWRTFDEARGRPRYIVEEIVRAASPSGFPAGIQHEEAAREAK